MREWNRPRFIFDFKIQDRMESLSTQLFIFCKSIREETRECAAL